MDIIKQIGVFEKDFKELLNKSYDKDIGLDVVVIVLTNFIEQLQEKVAEKVVDILEAGEELGNDTLH